MSNYCVQTFTAPKVQIAKGRVIIMNQQNQQNQQNNAAAMIERAKMRLAEIKAAKEKKTAETEQVILKASANTIINVPSLAHKGWKIDASREWNAEQTTAIEYGLTGKSFCLIGAAGTGKTSNLKGIINTMVENNILPTIQSHHTTKWLRYGVPGVAIISFTNMAVRQVAKHFSKEITCVTGHKLIEFAPVFYEIENDKGEMVKTMRFEPTRHGANPLPPSLALIIVDESSMFDIGLRNQVIAALPRGAKVQWIFLGDLNQLPPVYGRAVLGQQLLELPIVELKHVYRQALESPIIELAHKMKDGKSIPISEKVVIDKGEHGKLTIHPWSKSIRGNDACMKAADFIKAAIKQQELDIYKDMVLCPHNIGSADPDKNFSAVELNRSVADWLGRQRDAQVYEVVAGFKTHYFAAGDKVLVNKREAIITAIQWNRAYSGKTPVNPDIYKLDRWGGATKRASADKLSSSELYQATHGDTDVDAILASLVDTHTTVEDRKTSSSHVIKVRFINGTDPTQWSRFDSLETDENFEEISLESAAEVNDMLFGYVISVHKSQGSEWRKVFILLHKVHSQMCSRELLYTAITRAAKELYIICEPDQGMKAGTLTKASKTPRIKGNTLAEKLVYLKEMFEKDAAEAAKKQVASNGNSNGSNNIEEDDE